MALFGLDADTFDGTCDALAAMMADDHRSTLRQRLDAAITSRSLYHAEARMYLPDGTDRWVLSTAQPVVDDHGTVIRLIGTNLDITTYKQAEEAARRQKETEAALRESEEHFRNLVELNPQVPWTADPLGNILDFNDHWLELTGLTRAQALGEGWMQVPHPDDRPHVVAAWKRSIRTGQPYDIEHRIRLADGTYRWMRSRASPRRDASGRIVRWYGATEDIDDRKRAEAEQRAATAALRAAMEREQALRVQAEEASHLKDEFLAIVSHELRTPLTAFLGYAQLLHARKRDEAYIARAVEKMIHSARVQAQLIEDLLDMSRIVNGKLHIELHPLDLGEAIRGALDAVRPTVEAKRLELQIDLPREAVRVMGDPERLQQVSWNLLANAAKFTPPGGMIVVRLAPQDQEVELTVSDTGRGIRPEFLPFVFDHFRQAEGSSHRTQNGLGLGLAIVRHLIELHGGSVQADSLGEGKGATFTVRLPLASDKPPDQPADQPPSQNKTSGDTLGLRGVRVLLVDDQPDILEVVREILTSYGAVVLSCLTAREALDRVPVWQPQVLVSDIAMPGEDGYWLIRALRALPPEQGGALPAIALTAYVQIEDRLRALAAGFQSYVPKPVEPSELYTVITGLVRPGDAGGLLAAATDSL